ncbi:stage III sporulation protein AE [Lachnospiraceae bacterium ZAX-1]
MKRKRWRVVFSLLTLLYILGSQINVQANKRNEFNKLDGLNKRSGLNKRNEFNKLTKSNESNKSKGSKDMDLLDITQLDEVDFDELDVFLEDVAPVLDIDFRALAKSMIAGEEIDKKWLFRSIRDIIFEEVSQCKNYMLQIILIAIAFAILNNFANVFENVAVSDISFYMVYMILLALLMQSFLILNGILSDSLTLILDFMRALMPAFCMTMIFSSGSVTTIGFYQLTLFIIYLIEWVLIYIAVPAIHIYVMLELMNHLTSEELISRLTELLKIGVEWLLKFLFTLVVGINVVQGLLSPVIDSFRTTLFAKTASMLPGVGTSIHAVSEIMVGSGIIIKNGVGVAGILVLLLLCVGPMIKIAVMTVLYKLVAAAIQPVADKRIAGCINGVGEGARLINKVMVTAGVMFLVTIALVSAATTWNR